MNQVEVKRRQIQSFSYVLACINIWVFGKASEITAWDIWQRLFWYLPCSGCLPGKICRTEWAECFGAEMPGGSIGMSPECVRT